MFSVNDGDDEEEMLLLKRVGKVGGKHTAICVPVLLAMKDYNRFMEGVNQLIGSYSPWRKSRKWHLTVLDHFLDIAVTNSYLLHKELCGSLE